MAVPCISACRTTKSLTGIVPAGDQDLRSLRFLRPSGRIGAAHDNIFTFLPAQPFSQSQCWLQDSRICTASPFWDPVGALVQRRTASLHTCQQGRTSNLTCSCTPTGATRKAFSRCRLLLFICKPIHGSYLRHCTALHCKQCCLPEYGRCNKYAFCNSRAILAALVMPVRGATMVEVVPPVRACMHFKQLWQR